MKIPKAEVATMLDALPDNSSFENIQYHLYVLEKINRGLERVAIEGAIPHEDAQIHLAKWLAA